MTKNNQSNASGKDITICDVAAELGLSPSGVSKALKGIGRISKETCERVRETADRMGYRPSFVARSLVTQRTSTIGIVVPVLEDSSCSQMVDGIESVIRKRGYSMFVSTENPDPNYVNEPYDNLRGRRVEGIIPVLLLDHKNITPTVSLLLSIEDQGTPVVVLDQSSLGVGLTTVGSDNCAGSKRIVEHLISLGHKRIGHVYMGDFVRNERELGYRAAMNDAGLEIDESLVAPLGEKDVRSRNPVIESFAQYMRDAGRPTAIFAIDDALAIKVIRACHILGLAVPKDVAVAGYGDIMVAEHTIPSLTTVHVPAFEMGVRAAEILFDRISGKLTEHTSETLAGRLIVRESCGADIWSGGPDQVSSGNSELLDRA